MVAAQKIDLRDRTTLKPRARGHDGLLDLVELRLSVLHARDTALVAIGNLICVLNVRLELPARLLADRGEPVGRGPNEQHVIVIDLAPSDAR